MPTANDVQRYMDILARAATVVAKFSAAFSQLLALQNFERVREETFKRLEDHWKKMSLREFLHFLGKMISEIKRWKSQRQYIVAFAICEWMDEKLLYFSNTKGMFCASELISFDGSSVIEVGAMNRNYRQTGLQVIPKFEVCRLHYPQDKEEISEGDSKNLNSRSFANRNAFSGLNGTLKKVALVSHENGLHIHNVILPPKYSSKADGEITVAFCPMSDAMEPVTECSAIKIGSFTFSGQSIIGLKHPEEIYERFCQDWTTAAEEADIIFFPEALGSKALMEILKQGDFKYNKTVLTLQNALQKRGGRPPLLTVMPSFWTDGENRTDILYMDGRIIGTQRKYVPYVNEKKHVIEALREFPEKDYYIFHIPGFHRVVVIICSEFLAVCNGREKSPLFGEAGATLVLVPSYSPGENDFLNALPSLKPYGATVIWGNCCGAVELRNNKKDPRIIGASSVAGTNATCWFREARNCSGSCTGRQSCVFTVSLPLIVNDTRPNALKIKKIRHLPENDTLETNKVV